MDESGGDRAHDGADVGAVGFPHSFFALRGPAYEALPAAAVLRNASVFLDFAKARIQDRAYTVPTRSKVRLQLV